MITETECLFFCEWEVLGYPGRGRAKTTDVFIFNMKELVHHITWPKHKLRGKVLHSNHYLSPKIQELLTVSNICVMFFRCRFFFEGWQRLRITAKLLTAQFAFSCLCPSFRFQFHGVWKTYYLFPLSSVKKERIFYPPIDMTFFCSVIVSTSFEHCDCRPFRGVLIQSSGIMPVK